MFAWIRTAKIQKIERSIAGKKARLEAYKDLAEQAKTIPWVIVLKMTNLPDEIAQLEKQLEHLSRHT